MIRTGGTYDITTSVSVRQARARAPQEPRLRVGIEHSGRSCVAVWSTCLLLQLKKCIALAAKWLQDPTGRSQIPHMVGMVRCSRRIPNAEGYSCQRRTKRPPTSNWYCKPQGAGGQRTHCPQAWAMDHSSAPVGHPGRTPRLPAGSHTQAQNFRRFARVPQKNGCFNVNFPPC